MDLFGQSAHFQELCDVCESWYWLILIKSVVPFLFGIVENIFLSIIIYVLEKCPKNS
jgi:hypothetical protein